MSSQPVDLITESVSSSEKNLALSSTSIDVEKNGVSSTVVDEEKGEAQPLKADIGLYSMFSKKQKIGIIIIASWAAFFSPVSSNIYFPALNDLAGDLHVSDSLINLTITSYMIFQALAPMFTAAASDETGRRPAYLICMVVYLGANIGIACQSNYAALFVLRCLQSAGSSGTITLVKGSVTDLATSQERGIYMAWATSGAILGPTIGPIIGGLLAQFLGWRSIFWFLTIFAGVALVAIFIFMPETCRTIVGDGSIPAQKWNVSVVTYFKQRKQDQAELAAQRRETKGPGWPNPIPSLRIAVDKESGLVLFYSTIVFCSIYIVNAAMPSQFAAIYGFNSLQIGLCYIPIGIGSLVSIMSVGRLTDWNFRRHARIAGIDIAKGRESNLEKYPLEVARLQIAVPLVALNCVMLIIFGWVLETKRNLAAPLICLFVLGFVSVGCWEPMSLLVIDLNPTTAGASTAAGNLVRCGLGAGAVASVLPCINRIGNGWTFTLMSGICIFFSPIMFIVMRFGPQWRQENALKLENAQKKRVAKLAAATNEKAAGDSS